MYVYIRTDWQLHPTRFLVGPPPARPTVDAIHCFWPYTRISSAIYLFDPLIAGGSLSC